MGQTGSKQRREGLSLEGYLWDDMRARYGNDWQASVQVWVKDYDFPKAGSLSLRVLDGVEKRLRMREAELKKKKKMNTAVWTALENHRTALQIFREEAERRLKKQSKSELNQLPCSDPAPDCVTVLSEKSRYEKLYPSLPAPMPAMTSVSRTRTQTPVTSALPRAFQCARVDYELDGFVHGTKAEEGSPSPPPLEGDGAEASSSFPPPPPPPQVAKTEFDAKAEPAPEGAATSGAVTTRTQTKKRREQEVVVSLPMFEVGGAAGPQLVFRPWTLTEIKEAATRLPDPHDSGERFAEEFRAFCREFRPTLTELKRLLAMRLKPTDWDNLKSHMPKRDARCEKVDWDENHEYVQAIEAIAKGIETVFPSKVNLLKIDQCRQREDESAADFYARFWNVYIESSGMGDAPEGYAGKAEATLWEQHFRNSFVKGLKREIVDELQKTCVGYDEARLVDIRKHAIHVDKNQTAARRLKLQKKDDDMHKSALCLYNAARQAPFKHGRGSRRGRFPTRGRGSRRGRGGASRSDACFQCGEVGHWAAQCPAGAETED